MLIARGLHQVGHPRVSNSPCLHLVPLDSFDTYFVFAEFTLVLLSHKAVMVFNNNLNTLIL